MIELEVAVFGESRRGWLQMIGCDVNGTVLLGGIVDVWKIPKHIVRKRNNLKVNVKRRYDRLGRVKQPSAG